MTTNETTFSDNGFRVVADRRDTGQLPECAQIGPPRPLRLNKKLVVLFRPLNRVLPAQLQTSKKGSSAQQGRHSRRPICRTHCNVFCEIQLVIHSGKSILRISAL
jgi:hypothetical protein